MGGIGRTVLRVLVLGFVSLCNSDEYIVVPGDGKVTIDNCPEGYSECNNLSYYAGQSDVYFTSDTILTFLPGTHILDYSGPIVISDVSNLTLQGNGSIEDGFHKTVKQSDVVITCNGRKSGFLVKNFNGVTFSGLTITKCGVNILPNSRLVPDFSYSFSVFLNALFSVLISNGTDLLLEGVSVQNGTGYGFVSVNVYNVVITSSSFSRNNIDCIRNTSFGGNVGILYLDSPSCPATLPYNSNTSVVINSVSISFGKTCGSFGSPILLSQNSQAGAGLALNIFSLKCGRPVVKLEDVTLIGNEANVGANMAYFGAPVDMYINRLNCSEGRNGTIGSGLWMLLVDIGSYNSSSELRIINSYFIGNQIRKALSGTASAFILTSLGLTYDKILIKDCSFLGNEGSSIIRFEENDYLVTHATDLSRVVLSNVTIHGSSGFNSRGTNDFIGALVLVNTACSVTNLNVSDNPVTGVHLVYSSIRFVGVNHIQNNSFTNGGGITLTGLSTIYLHSSTILNFIDNRATDYGGAIYVADDPGKTYFGPCFYQIEDLSELSSPNIVVNAINNTAGITGDFLQGGNLETCYYAALFPPVINFLTFTGLQYLLPLIQPRISLPGNYHLISQSPAGVVVCNTEGVFNTTLRVLNDPPFYFVPGKLFNISLATINTQIGISPGKIVASIYNCSNDTSTCLREEPLREIFAESPNECFNMSIVITADKFITRLIIKFATFGEIPFDAFSPLYVTFEPKDCPPGFTRTDICECNEFVKSTGAMCNINTTSISTNGSVWIGYDNTSNATLYSYDCPIGYCVSEPVTFNILEPDAQCAYNRSGILCGGCAEGYSLLLGSNECGECPNNNYLSLLLVFGIAGILLVVLLILLNLTVSVGTINGLIFYANIVKINEQVFLPFSESHPVVLRQFISFMNLDFGIQTCFYNGMTAYMKAWLQFVFPLYIWLIMIVVMLLSRRFMKLARVIGNNAVKVFATLLLLSYTKIIRQIGVVLSIQQYYDDGSSILGWLSDSNIAVSKTEVKQAILVIVSVLILLFLVLPYTIFLISLPFIEKVFAKLRCKFLWLKPFADAYGGPFKHRRQFWVGLLLLYRVYFTAITATIVPHDIPLLINVLIIILLLNIMVSIGGLYEKNYLNILESWMLSNLLAISVLALTHDDDLLKVGASVSIGLVLVTFSCVCVFHSLMEGRNLFRSKKKSTEEHDVRVNSAGMKYHQPSLTMNNVKDTHITSTASYNDTDLREPLLDIVEDKNFVK